MHHTGQELQRAQNIHQSPPYRWGLQKTKFQDYTKPFICTILFSLLGPLGTDASQHIRTEQANREDDQDKRHNQVDKGGKHLTDLKRHAAHGDGEVGDTLACGGSGGEDGREDTIGQGREELGDHGPKVERGSQDNDIASIKHFGLLKSTYFIFMES